MQDRRGGSERMHARLAEKPKIFLHCCKNIRATARWIAGGFVCTMKVGIASTCTLMALRVLDKLKIPDRELHPPFC